MKEFLSVEEKRRLIVLNSIFMKIQKTLEASIGQSSARVLYTAGEEFGRTYMDLSKRENKAITIQDLLTELEATDFIRAEFDSGDLSFRVYDSPIALNYGESEEPVCHFLAGFFTGIASEYFGEEHVRYTETSCKASNDSFCTFNQEKE